MLRTVYRIIVGRYETGCYEVTTWTWETVYLSKKKAEEKAKELTEKFSAARNEDGDRVYYSFNIDSLQLDEEES